MKPYYEEGNVTVFAADCIEAMKAMADNSVDSILTDPPYELAFMGKKWDNNGIAFNTEVWGEALRVAKPGATLMACGGSRTYHRLTCAIEDAGWEIRDCVSYFHDGTQQERALMASLDEEQLGAYLELHRPAGTMCWITGQGFPKSLDVGKAIDSAAGAEREVVGRKVDISSGRAMSVKQAKAGTDHNLHEGYDRPWRKDDEHAERMTQITAPSTPLAKLFSGYHSNLKPAAEFIVVAQAPLDGTYAQNAQRHGISGLNIDGARVEYRNGKTPDEEQKKYAGKGGKPSAYFGNVTYDSQNPSHPTGRYPSNVISSGEPGIQREFDKAGVRTSGAKPAKANKPDSFFVGNNHKNLDGTRIKYDSGSASRYFQTCPPDAVCLDCTACIDDPQPTEASAAIPCPDCGGKGLVIIPDDPPTYEGICRNHKTVDGPGIYTRAVDGKYCPECGEEMIELEVAGRPSLCLTCWGQVVGGPEETPGVFTKEQAAQALEKAKGRWPSNVISDGSDNVEREFDKAGVSIARPSVIKANKSNRQVYDGGDLHNRIDRAYNHNDSGTPSRYFQTCPPDSEPARFSYHSKASKKDRGKGNTHPCVKPTSLMRYLARLLKPPTGGVILDLFAGSGSTGVAAQAEGYEKIILIEKEPEYCEIIVNRLEGKADVGPAAAKATKKAEPQVEQMSLF